MHPRVHSRLKRRLFAEIQLVPRGMMHPIGLHKVTAIVTVVLTHGTGMILMGSSGHGSNTHSLITTCKCCVRRARV